MLEVREVSRSFGGLLALKAVSFTVGRGEVVGVIGPNGAGKTTLFHVITGFLKPDRGSVRFDGRDITGLPSHTITRLGLCRTFQLVKPFAGLSVLDNVVIGALARSARVSEAEADATTILRRLGLYSIRDKLAGSLPVGLRKKLELARALATRPRVLLLDEVMQGLTPAEVNEMMDVIRELHEDGLTILAIEHNMHAIMRLAQRIVVLNYGEKIAEGTPEQIARHPAVVAAYLGEAYSLA